MLGEYSYTNSKTLAQIRATFAKVQNFFYRIVLLAQL